jgi:hypothetical protein
MSEVQHAVQTVHTAKIHCMKAENHHLYPPPSLSDEDGRHLESLERKLQLIRDRTEGVARGLHTGLHVYGDPGVGKTYTVLDELERLQTPHRLTNSRITGRALFDLLARYPEEIHVLDDVESLTLDVNGAGVLRAALWGQGRRDLLGRLERVTTWETHKEKRSVVFVGGIIMIGNRPLDDLPELQALKTRIATIQLQTSDREVAAMMRAIASRGYRLGEFVLSLEECLEVAEFVIAESRQLQQSLNLRSLINGLADYLQWSDCGAGCHWRDLISSRLRQRPVIHGEIEGLGIRERKKREELKIAREIMDMPREGRLDAWKKRTGKSESAFYRRLNELAVLDNQFDEK